LRDRDCRGRRPAGGERASGSSRHYRHPTRQRHPHRTPLLQYRGRDLARRRSALELQDVDCSSSNRAQSTICNLHLAGAMPYADKVEPGKKSRLRDYDSGRDDGMTKEEGQALFAQFNAELDEMQEQLYAAGQHSILIILQGMDTSGKDGAIRNVLQNVNP